MKLSKKDELLNIVFIAMGTLIFLGFCIASGIRLKYEGSVNPIHACLAIIIADTITLGLGIFYLIAKNKRFIEIKGKFNPKWMLFEFISIGTLLLNVILSMGLMFWIKQKGDGLGVAVIVSLILIALINTVAVGMHEYAHYKIKMDLARLEQQEEAKEQEKEKEQEETQDKKTKTSSEIKDADSTATAGKFYE